MQLQRWGGGMWEFYCISTGQLFLYHKIFFVQNDTNLFIKRETLSPPPSNNPPFTTSTHPVTSSNTRLTNNLATGYNNNQMPDLVRSNQQVNKLSGDGCNRKESNLKRGACSGGMVINNNSCMNKPNLAGRKVIKQEPDIHVQVQIYLSISFFIFIS